MKIRWTRKSIRFRITPAELTALINRESVSEELVFAGQGVWTAAIVPTRLETTVTLIESTATIYLSDSDIDQLSLPESEGFYLSQRSPDAITYFIEKDFPCVHPRLSELIEAPSETFPAPARFEERKSSASIT